MAQAAPAYRFDTYPEIAEPRFSSSDVRAIRTGRHQANQAQSSTLVTLAKMAAVVFVVVAALCFARIGLTNAAVKTMIESDAISAQISEARTAGVSLEMEQSVLTSSSAINQAVKRLNMGAPYEIGTIELEPDVVAVDANGTLSFSNTVKNVAGTQG